MDPLSSSSNNLHASYEGGAPKECESVYQNEDREKKPVDLGFLGELAFTCEEDPFKLSMGDFGGKPQSYQAAASGEDAHQMTTEELAGLIEELEAKASTAAEEERVANGSVDSTKAVEDTIDIYDGKAICDFMFKNYPDYFEMEEVFEIATKLLDIEEKLYGEFHSQLEGELSFVESEVMWAAVVEQTSNISEGFWQRWEKLTGRDSPDLANISFVVKCTKKGPGKLELQLSVTDPEESLSDEAELTHEALKSMISRIKRTKENAQFLDYAESQIAAEIEKKKHIDKRDLDELVTMINAEEEVPLTAKQRRKKKQKAAKKAAKKWERLVLKMRKSQQKTARVTRRWALFSLKLARFEAHKDTMAVKCFSSWGRRLQVKEFRLAYLNRAATTLQSVARGYLIRRETGKVLEVMRKLRGALKALEEKTKEFAEKGSSDLSLVRNIRDLSEEVLKLSEEKLAAKGDHLESVTHKEER